MDLAVAKEKARDNWVNYYLKCKSISLTAERFGISRPTVYRWLNRYKLKGKSGLSEKSKRPLKLTNQKVNLEIENLILSLRKSNKWGPLRISNHLKRKKRLNISSPTVWRVLSKNGVSLIKRNRKKSDYKRYSRLIPGDRVQMDVTKLKPGWYQFTAIDDCTRMKIIQLYNRKRAQEAIEFLGEVLDGLPFPVQRVQTDWGTEFFNDDFQAELHEHFIKFRPIKPRSPHLNGKVERTQQTDKSELWNTLDLKKNKHLPLRRIAKAWQDFYNMKRPHSALAGKTPYRVYKDRIDKIPIQPDVTKCFWESEEEIKVRNSYWLKSKEKLGL